MSDIVKILLNPPFGTETSERNIMAMAADRIESLRGRIWLLLDIIDNYDIGSELADEDRDVIETIREAQP